ncbi:MAG: ROK family protein [Ethanoligenens sp.]
MYQIGVDLGGTNIAIGLVDDERKIILKDSVPTALPRSAQEIIEDIATLTRSLVERAGLSLSDARWVGLGTPVRLTCKRALLSMPTISNLKMCLFAKCLKQRLAAQSILKMMPTRLRMANMLQVRHRAALQRL